MEMKCLTQGSNSADTEPDYGCLFPPLPSLPAYMEWWPELDVTLHLLLVSALPEVITRVYPARGADGQQCRITYVPLFTKGFKSQTLYICLLTPNIHCFNFAWYLPCSQVVAAASAYCKTVQSTNIDSAAITTALITARHLALHLAGQSYDSPPQSADKSPDLCQRFRGYMLFVRHPPPHLQQCLALNIRSMNYWCAKMVTAYHTDSSIFMHPVRSVQTECQCECHNEYRLCCLHD